MPLLVAIFLLLVPSVLGAQERVQPNTVSVSGTASVSRQPDRAVVDLAVESFAAEARDAAAENAQKMEAVIRALRRAGLDQDQIRTVGYNVIPEYDQSRDLTRQQGEDRLVGYRVRNMVRATIDDIAQTGDLIDVAITAGANRVANLSFELRNPDSARQDALRLALDKARAEAMTIAGAVGRRLGPVVAVTTTGTFSAPQYLAMRSASMATGPAMPPPPIEPGLLEISAQVSVVYGLEPSQ